MPIILLVSVAVKYYDKVEQKQKELPAIFSGGRIPTWISRIQTFIYTDKNTDSEKLYQTNQAKIAVAKAKRITKEAAKAAEADTVDTEQSVEDEIAAFEAELEAELGQ